MTRSNLFLFVAFSISACSSSTAAPDKTRLAGAADSAAASAEICTEEGYNRDCDVCEAVGWYNDGICDEFCPRYDEEGCGPRPAAPTDEACAVLNTSISACVRDTSTNYPTCLVGRSDLDSLRACCDTYGGATYDFCAAIPMYELQTTRAACETLDREMRDCAARSSDPEALDECVLQESNRVGDNLFIACCDHHNEEPSLSVCGVF